MGKKREKESSSSKKSKKEGKEEMTDKEPESTILYVSPIAKPLATKKSSKKFLRLIKKATKQKVVRRGVKEVVKAIRKSELGLCLIAGDISPIDVITHLPILCEEAKIPYLYVPSKEALGAASATKRPTSCVLVSKKKLKGSKYEDLYQECEKEINEISSA